MNIDVDRLRKDMIDEAHAAYFVGGFGAALLEIPDVENASDEELIELAISNGINIKKYKL